jgi:hypothetical protein
MGCFGLLFDTEDGGSIFFRNDDELGPNYNTITIPEDSTVRSYRPDNPKFNLIILYLCEVIGLSRQSRITDFIKKRVATMMRRLKKVRVEVSDGLIPRPRSPTDCV